MEATRDLREITVPGAALCKAGAGPDPARAVDLVLVNAPLHDMTEFVHVQRQEVDATLRGENGQLALYVGACGLCGYPTAGRRVVVDRHVETPERRGQCVRAVGRTTANARSVAELHQDLIDSRDARRGRDATILEA